MQNILTNICNLCCCKPHHTHWPDDIRHTRSCWNRNECHEIVPSMHVNQKLLTTGENVTGTQNTSPPLFNIKFTQHILCNYFMHSGLQCRCKSSCTHTQTAWGSDPEGGRLVTQSEATLCKVSKHVADCPKLRQRKGSETNMQADTKRSSHPKCRLDSQQSPWATIPQSSSRSSAQTQSIKSANPLHNLQTEVQDYATDIPENAD